MFKFILLPAIALLAATPTPVAATEQDDMNLCAEVGRLAQTIMTVRQSGTTMSQAMELTLNLPGDPVYTRLARAMVLGAYKMPQFETAYERSIAIEGFSSGWLTVCYRTVFN